MIDDLRPHAEIRPSGLPWLGNVPSHWDVKRSKYIFREVDKRSTTGEETHLSMSQRHGLVPAGQITRSLVSESYAGGKLVERDDLVLNRLKAHLGVFAYAKQPGVISPDYTVLRPQDGAEVRYFEAVLKSPACRGELFTRAKGIVEGFWRLYTDDFYNISVPVPPLDEQRLIVRFLDWHGGQVARLVRAKKALIGLLNEQKQAIIHRAVTRGLDPNAKLKPAGISWLGEVPEGWDIANLRYLVRCLDGKRRPLNGTQRGSMQGEYPYWGANRVFDHINAWIFDEPLVLLGEDGAPFFEPGRDVAFAVTGKIWVNNHAHILRCGPRITPRFLAHVLNCVDYKPFISGSTRDKLTQQAMGGISIQVPDIQEQLAIVSYIEQATGQLLSAISAIQREIALIQEFRTRIVADVVTGKLDVRALAATLPETASQDVTFDLAEDEDLDDLPEDADTEEAAA